MLFTPSPPLFSQSVSSTVGNESSSTRIASVYSPHDVENRLHTVSLSNNTTILANGTANNRLSPVSQSPDQDYFYSPLSSSLFACPSIRLTRPKIKANIKLSKLHRGDSCPVLHIAKNINNSYFPTSISSSSRNVLMATMGKTDPAIYHSEDILQLPRTHLLSGNTSLPVANPAALIKHNELEIVEEQLTTSITPSPFGTSKNSELFQR
ncbi:unnamed protein product, partial [Rotaria magnacalcarata]